MTRKTRHRNHPVRDRAVRKVGHDRVEHLNRPEHMNALSFELRGALNRKVRHAVDDDEVMLLVISGAGGPAFSADNDLKDSAERYASRIVPGTEVGPDDLDAAGAKSLVVNSISHPYQVSLTQEGEALVDQWRGIGVELRNQRVDYNSFVSAWVLGNLQEATTTGWFASTPAADSYSFEQLHSKSSGNRGQINDPRLDELTSKQRVELNPDRRRELLKQIYDYDLEQVYRIPFPASNGFDPYQPWMHGMRFGGALGTSSSTYDWAAQLNTACLSK